MGQRKDAFGYSQLALCIAILAIMFATITTSVVSSLAQKVKKPVRQSANRGVDIQSADSNIRDSAEAKGGSIAVTAEVTKQNLLDTVTRGRVSQNQSLAVALASGYGRNGSDSLYYRNLDKLLRGNDTVVDLDHAPDSHPTEFNEELATASKELLGVEGWEGLRQGLEKFINSPHVSSSNPSMIPKMRVELEQFEDKVKTADSRIKYNKHFASMLMSIEMARVTLISEGITYDMLNKMVNDALIQRKGTYIIEKKDDELFINGTRQADDVLKKYMVYLKAKNVSITERDFAIKSYHSENLHSSYTSEVTEPPYR